MKKKGAQPTYFREPHIICQRAACGSRAAVWSPLLYNHHLHTFLSLSCYWPVDGCPTAIDVFSLCGKIKMFVRVVRSVVVLRLGETRDICQPDRILRDTGTELFKSHKTRNEWDPYPCKEHRLRNKYSLHIFQRSRLISGMSQTQFSARRSVCHVLGRRTLK
jgi:hypothetical protein